MSLDAKTHKSLPPVLILHTDDVGNEHEAIRQTLEYFGYEVFNKAIGRPADFVDFISGKNEWSARFPIWVLSVHGEEGRIIMPELGNDVYFEGEPRVPIGPELLSRHARFSGQCVLTTGCSLGSGQMARAFIENGADSFIAPADYIEGNAALLFIHHFFYQLTLDTSDKRTAFLQAQGIDKETRMFTWKEK